MVDPIDLQQVLAGSMIATDVKKTSKEKEVGDKAAFNSELEKLSRLKQSQVGQSQSAETQNRIREGDEHKEEGKSGHQHDGKKDEETELSKGDSVNNVPQPTNPNLLTDEEHEIDLQA